MSTRANIILKDGDEHLFFYRHSDGYPEGVKSTLYAFTRLIKSGKLRNNLSQCAGWLVLLGAIEYQTLPAFLFSEHGKRMMDMDGDKIVQNIQALTLEWKCGAYEPTTGIHGDIDYLYIVDVNTGDYAMMSSNFENWAEAETRQAYEWEK